MTISLIDQGTIAIADEIVQILDNNGFSYNSVVNILTIAALESLGRFVNDEKTKIECLRGLINALEYQQRTTRTKELGNGINK